MSSFDRRVFRAGAADAAWSGCGFTPVYGPGGPAQSLRGSVAVDPPNNQLNFDLVEQLELRLGEPVSPEFGLNVQISVTEQRLGITTGEESTRISILGNAGFTMRNIANGAVVTSGNVQNFTSYTTTGTPFATLAAQQDAYKRLTVILADDIVSRLLVTSESWLT